MAKKIDNSHKKETDIFREIGAYENEQIKIVLEELEKLTGTVCIIYFTSFKHNAGAIGQEDAEQLEYVLRSIHPDEFKKGVSLVLSSPGGDAIGAEKIVNTIRSYTDKFTVIVPQSAMSAATIICMGADKIIMSKTSHLGPIDPQLMTRLPDGNIDVKPASIITSSYKKIIKDIQKCLDNSAKGVENCHPAPYFELLKSFDPVFVEFCEKARNIAHNLSYEFLAEYQLKGKKKATITKVVDEFLKVGEETAHNRPITADKAKKIGLNVELKDHYTAEWYKIWELYQRCNILMNNKGLVKIFFTTVNNSFSKIK